MGDHQQWLDNFVERAPAVNPEVVGSNPAKTKNFAEWNKTSVDLRVLIFCVKNKLLREDVIDLRVLIFCVKNKLLREEDFERVGDHSFCLPISLIMVSHGGF